MLGAAQSRASVYDYGCGPIHTVISSGWLVTTCHGAVSDSPALISIRENSGFMMPGILFGDGGSTLASPLPNAFAASIVFAGASELTNSCIPAHPRVPSQGVEPPCSTDQSAPLFVGPVPSKMRAILAQVLIVSSFCKLRGVLGASQINKSTFCPAKGASCFTKSGAAFSISRHLGPWAAMCPSSIPIFSDAAFSRMSSASASVFTASASSWAVLADLAASPNKATSYLWMALCESSSLAPYLHSPTTPITTAISPNRRTRFTHLVWSECDSACPLVSPLGKIVATSFKPDLCTAFEELKRL